MPILDPDTLAAIAARRDQWLGQGLCTQPADRSSAESAVIELYQRAGLKQPKFAWVHSPPAALKLIAEEGLSVPPIRFAGPHHSSAAIASLRHWAGERMDKRIDGRVGHKDRHQQLIRAAVWNSLRTSLHIGVATAMRTLLPSQAPGVTWYGQQDAHWVAYYDAFRHFGFASYLKPDAEILDLQATLVGATGWWWAFDDVCVMAERPSALHTEPTPDGIHNERRLHHLDQPALQFLDGNHVFVQHGTIVPDWVVLDPTVERINKERNIEIRRCAIERIGWDRYIETAELELVDRGDDPGNPESQLELHAHPADWGRTGRVLLVVNGSRERDGQRRRYGLHVPHWINSALNAAAWTYGLSGTDYAQLVRRT
ncbi:DUF6745 domain-containing protein [Hoyosella rhizosphaerae]|uniref:DUF6745 domain-containing protein n=1 Tax=Hoyosella rhizosphaerae TaxID=1755582 RepID=UPI001E46CE56|nr:hypothetical protein [Hoyosella rhizosphaerae]